MNVILIGELILILSFWILIALFSLFVLNSRKIYKKLKYAEEFCVTTRKEALFRFVPFMVKCSDYNKNLGKIPFSFFLKLFALRKLLR